jgi:hypothetical protein
MCMLGANPRLEYMVYEERLSFSPSHVTILRGHNLVALRRLDSCSND